MEQFDFAFQDSFGFINRMEIISPVFSTSKYYDVDNIDMCLESNLKDNSTKGKLNALKYFAYIYQDFLLDAKGDKLTEGNCEFIISEIDIRVSELSKKLRTKTPKIKVSNQNNSVDSSKLKHKSTQSRHEVYAKLFNELTREKNYNTEDAIKEICEIYFISEKTLNRAIKNN